MNKLLTEEQINKYVFLFSFLLYTTLGVAFTVKTDAVMKFAPYFLTAFFAYGALRAALAVLFKKDRHASLYECLLNAAFAVMVWFYPVIIKIFASVFMGLWFMLIGFIRFVSAWQLKISRARGALRNLIYALVCFAGAVFLFCSPSKGFIAVSLYIGVYLLLLGLTNLFDFIGEIPAYAQPYKKRKRIRITLPPLVTAFMPGKFIAAFDRFETLNAQAVETIDDISRKNAKAAMEIFIHINEFLPGRMGHVDLCIEDEVYSYGNYDRNSFYLFGMAGEGVIEIIEKTKYLRFCIEKAQKTIVSYGLALSEEQLICVKEKLGEIFSETFDWIPEKVTRTKAAFKKSRYMRDYAMRLFEETGARFYKFRQGSRFQQYFGLNMNCARLAQCVMSAAGGIDILKPNSVITPGLYYSYLNGEFLKKNSIVVSRRIYHREKEI